MTDAQLKAATKLLIVAGNETTANLLATLFHQLLADRARWERVGEDRSLIPGAVEEALRFDPPLNWVPRQALADCPLGEHTVPQGSTVTMGLGAANRDPQVFDRPDEFDIDRPDVRSHHLAFGHGEHFCLGAGLARIEAQVTLDVALDRLPGLRLAEDFVFEPKGPVMMRGAKCLPVTV
jgi:cytochrome P450